MYRSKCFLPAENGHDYGVVSWIEVFRVGPQENPTLTINVFGTASK